MGNRDVVVYIASSLDGYIAKKDGDLSWLEKANLEGQDFGYEQFMKDVDTILMGRKTFLKVLSLVETFPHVGKKCYVISRSIDPTEYAGREDLCDVVFYDKDPGHLLEQLRIEDGRSILIDGGSELIHDLREKDLINRYFISILPVFLGEGIPLFRPMEKEKDLELTGTRMYENGLVQLRYKRKKKNKNTK